MNSPTIISAGAAAYLGTISTIGTNTSASRNRIRSAMIAPIVDPTGCFGVLYIDNSMDHGHYDLSDLDYLMLVAIHTAAIIENF